MLSSNFDLLSSAFDQDNNKTGKAAHNQNVMNRVLELGMDPIKDQKLFWIAEQSLKAKLPEEWIECKTEEGQTYYYNLRNEDSTWQHPALDHYRTLYEKVKKQQNDNLLRKSSVSIPGTSTNPTNPTNLPEIGVKDSQNSQQQQSPRLLNSNSSGTIAANLLKQKKDAERLGGDVTFWRTRFELMEAEVSLSRHLHLTFLYS